jgi:hypothetical protein
MAVDTYGHWYDDPYGSPRNPYPGGTAAPPPAPPTPTTTTPADPGSTTPAPTTTAPTAYSDGAFQQILRKYPPSRDGVAQAIAEANKLFGVSITQFGSKGDKIALPDGRQFDVLVGAGTGSPQYGFNPIGSGGGGGGDLGSIAINPDYLAPWTRPAPSWGNIPTFNAPADFKQPTAEDLYADPSYTWRVDQGRGALENSAAAKGVLNSGGTLADILNYGQKAASQEYSNVWDRMFGAWNAKWNNELNTFRASKDVSDDMYGRAWQQYADAKDTWYRNQSEPFSKLMQAGSLGASAAG